MATQVVELSGDEANLLRALDRVIQKEREQAVALDRMGTSADNAGIALEEALKTVENAAKKTVDETVRQLNKLGPGGKAAAEALQAGLAEAGKGKVASVDGLLERVASLDPATAEVVGRVKQHLAEADNRAAFDDTLKSLRELGPEGRAIAEAYSQQMVTAATEAKGGIDGIIERLKAIDPTVEEVATKIRGELAAADAATKFDDSIRELQKINPEAAAAARKVREHMELADADVKFDQMIAELAKVDPAAAKAAAAMKGHMKSATDDGTNLWNKFTSSAITQVGALAGAYVGLDQAISTVNNYLKEQEALLGKALDKQLSLAQAQEKAAKNLASYSAFERDELLQQAVPEIAIASGVSDVNQITLALGDAASAGASPEEAKAAVMAAARANQFNPENIGAATGGAVSLMRQTILQDPRQTMALLQTAGPLSKIDDASKVAESLPRALGTVATVRDQLPEEAAKQVASLFAVATNVGVDESGQSTATFTIDFVNRMNSLFTDLENKQIDARSKIELIDRKIAKGSETEANLRDKAQLEQFLKDSAGMVDPGTIFGRLQTIQQNEGLQQQFLGDTGKFGEQQFQVFLKDVLDANSETARAVIAGASQIQADVAYFENQTTAQSTSTPQAVIANAAAMSQAAASATDAFDHDSSALQNIRTITASTLERTRAGGVRGFLQSFGEGSIERGALGGSTAQEEGVSAIMEMTSRLQSLQAGGVTTAEAPKIHQLEASISAIQTMMVNLIKSGSIDQEATQETITNTKSQSQFVRRVGESEADMARADVLDQLANKLTEAMNSRNEEIVAALNRQNELMEQNNNLLAETADNTAPGPAPTPDYDGINRAALAAEDSR